MISFRYSGQIDFFFLISKKVYIKKRPHENIRQNRGYREGNKKREKKKKKQENN